MDLPADVIIGDRQGLSASSDRVTLVESLLEHEALDVKRNHRFTGGWVVQQFESEPRVDAMQLEFNQRLYLNSAEVAQQVPRPRRKEREFEVMQRKLGHVLTLLIGESGKKDPQPS
jgi:N-formylglutamate amidohydrolase